MDRRCDKCGVIAEIVMGSPITSRETRAELNRNTYNWCLPCARERHPNFVPASIRRSDALAADALKRRDSGDNITRRAPWFERHEPKRQVTHA